MKVILCDLLCTFMCIENLKQIDQEIQPILSRSECHNTSNVIC